MKLILTIISLAFTYTTAQAQLSTNVILTCAHLKLPYTLIANPSYGNVRLIDQEFGSIAIQFKNLRVRTTDNQITFLMRGDEDMPETFFVFTQTTPGFGTAISYDDLAGSTSRYRCVSVTPVYPQ